MSGFRQENDTKARKSPESWWTEGAAIIGHINAWIRWALLKKIASNIMLTQNAGR